MQGGVGETSSAATSTTGITEVGSSVLVAQDSVLHGTHDLDSASQTNDHHDYVPIANLEVETSNLIPHSFGSFHLNIFALLFSLHYLEQ